MQRNRKALRKKHIIKTQRIRSLLRRRQWLQQPASCTKMGFCQLPVRAVSGKGISVTVENPGYPGIQSGKARPGLVI